MVKLIVGVRGTGKTAKLIEMVNAAADATNGAVVCIEKGNKLVHEITYKARLVDSDEYSICDAQSLYGFIAGMSASNHDITDIFVDSALKIVGNAMADFEKFVANLDTFTHTHDINIVMTSSIPVEEVTESLKGYIVNL